MANFNKSDGSLRPPPPKPKVKRKPRKVEYETCRACGFQMRLTAKFKMVNEALDGMCLGCAKHFGLDQVWGMGSTNMPYETTLEHLNEIEEAKHIIVTKSGNFGVENTGDMLGVDFGDIFEVARVGASEDMKPTGQWDYAMKAFTISIKINGHDLVLFPHEVMPIHWIAIMELKKSGDYCEAYLSTEDSSGYWKPSDEMKAEMNSAYGDR